MSVEEMATFERIEWKVDEVRAMLLEILTWKSEVEEIMNGMQTSPIMSAFTKMFGGSK